MRYDAKVALVALVLSLLFMAVLSFFGCDRWSELTFS